VRSADSGGQHDLTFEVFINPEVGMSHALVLRDSIAGHMVLGSLRVPGRRWPRERKPGC
jgi:hypothetical protein